jgi:hypothetical protein
MFQPRGRREEGRPQRIPILDGQGLSQYPNDQEGFSITERGGVDGTGNLFLTSQDKILLPFSEVGREDYFCDDPLRSFRHRIGDDLDRPQGNGVTLFVLGIQFMLLIGKKFWKFRKTLI